MPISGYSTLSALRESMFCSVLHIKNSAGVLQYCTATRTSVANGGDQNIHFKKPLLVWTET